MRALISFVALIATAAAQPTLTSASTARPASIPTASIAIYPPEPGPDSWLCVTKNYSDYLHPPMPTGHLLDVYYDHADAIFKECMDKLPEALTSLPDCTSIAKES